MQPKEQRAVLLSDPARFKRAEIAQECVALIHRYLNKRDAVDLEEARSLLDALQHLDATPKVHSTRCGVHSTTTS